MIVEGEDRLGVSYFDIGAKRIFHQRFGHRSHWLVREANIGHGKKRIPWFNRLNPDLPRLEEGMARDYLLHYSHRPTGSPDRRQSSGASQPRLVVVKEPSVFHNPFRDWIQAIGESI